MSVKIRRTWHYGNDRNVCTFEAGTLAYALELAKGDMPHSFKIMARVALERGDEFRAWSWYTFEVVEAD